jgi:hypothetical protein
MILIFLFFLFFLHGDSFYQPILQQYNGFYSLRKPYSSVILKKPPYFTNKRKTLSFSSDLIQNTFVNPFQFTLSHQKHKSFFSSSVVSRSSHISSSRSSSRFAASSPDSDSDEYDSGSWYQIHYFKMFNDTKFAEERKERMKRVDEARKKKFAKYELYKIDKYEKDAKHVYQLDSILEIKQLELWKEESRFFPYRVKLKKWLTFLNFLILPIFLCFHKRLAFVFLVFFYVFYCSLIPALVISDRTKARWSAVKKRWKEFLMTVPSINREIKVFDDRDEQLEHDLKIYLQQEEDRKKKENSAYSGSSSSHNSV